MTEHMEGLVAAAFTPMLPDGHINLEMIVPLAQHLQQSGLAGVFVCGTTGEGLSLTLTERLDVAEAWTRASSPRLRVIVHVGDNSIEACRAMARHAQEHGAWGVACMAPSFFRPGCVSGLVDFCARVAAAAPDLPFYYYHLPAMTGVQVPMLDFLLAAEARIPNLAGIKFTSEDLMDYARCAAFDGGRYDLLFGRDEILLAGLALGARGAIGSTYNFAAALYQRILSAWARGDLSLALQEQQRSMEMVAALRESCPVLVGGKAAMKMIGLDCGSMRPPLRSLTPVQYDRLRNNLASLGVLSPNA